ncbi:MAG: hypothetical protein Q9200_002786 [Gallowayella weberi]
MSYSNTHHKHHDERSITEESATKASSVSDSTKNAQFIRNVHRLPREIYLQIQRNFLELAFYPGFVFPQQPTSNKDTFNWKGKLYPVAKPGLLCLNKSVLATHQKHLWWNNTFVIGVGIPSYTTYFLYRLPLEAYDYIRKIHLTFTTQDHMGSPFKTKSEMPIQLFADLDRDDADEAWEAEKGVIKSRKELDSITGSLFTTWFNKYNAIHTLHLEELTLDFTNCYGPTGDWLGGELAERLHRLRHGPPKVLTVLAPSEEKRRRILMAMADEYALMRWNI